MPSLPAALAAMERQAVEHVRDVARRVVVPTFGKGDTGHHWRTSTQVHTEADARAGQAFAELFAASFPTHALVIEDRQRVDGDGVHEWYIDPIDGSANHLRGIPYVSLTVGLTIDGEPVVGVVHDLVRDLTFAAHRGGGARVLDTGGGSRPVQVSDTPTLADAMAIVHLSRRGPLLNLEGALPRLLWNVRKIRCMGSIALDLALIARGDADLLVVGRGTPQRQLDIKGGLAVLAEAGGTVVTTEGLPATAESRTLIAGPPRLCAQLVELMADFDLETWTAEQARRPG